MIERIRYSIGGSRQDLEELLRFIGGKAEILDGVRCRMYITLERGTPEQRTTEEFLAARALDVGRRSELTASKDELTSTELFSNVGCCWIEDDEDTLSPVSITGEDACPQCGKGIRAHADPLRGAMRSLGKYQLVRKPPPWVLGSTRLCELVRVHGWSGVEVRPIIERTTGRESNEFSELWITSVMPRMHPSAGIERLKPSEFCETCMRLGYQLTGRQPAYGRSVLEVATDWNLSTEWLAPHFVPCPKLICSQRVVQELLRLEPTQKWIPVRLVED
jgi:hypothetical protein